MILNKLWINVMKHIHIKLVIIQHNQYNVYQIVQRLMKDNYNILKMIFVLNHVLMINLYKIMYAKIHVQEIMLILLIMKIIKLVMILVNIMKK